MSRYLHEEFQQYNPFWQGFARRKIVPDFLSGFEIDQEILVIKDSLQSLRKDFLDKRSPFFLARKSLLKLEISKAIKDNKNHEKLGDALFSAVIKSVFDEISEFITSPETGFSSAFWENEFRQSLVNIYQKDSKLLFKLCDSFLSVVLYSCRNNNYDLEKPARRAQNFAKIKNIFRQDALNFVNDSEDFLTDISPNSFLQDIEDFAAQILPKFFLTPDKNKVKTFVKSVMQGTCNEFLGLEILCDDLRNIVEDFTLNSSKLVLEAVCDKIYEIILKISESNQELFYKNFLQECDFLPSFVQNSLKTAKMENLVLSVVSDFSLLKNKNAVKNFIAKNLLDNPNFIKKKITLSQKESQIIDLIMVFNCYMLQGKSLPLWLQDDACEILTIKIKPELKDNKIKYYQELQRKILFELTLYQKYLDKIEVPVKIMFSQNNLHFAKITNLLDINDLIACGASLDLIKDVMQKNLSAKISDFDGLLFHPNRIEIIDFIVENGLFLNVSDLINEAIIFGDALIIQRFYLEVMQKFVLWNKESNFPDFSLNNIVFLLESLDCVNDLSNEDLLEIAVVIFSSRLINQDKILLVQFFQNSDKFHENLGFLEEKFGLAKLFFIIIKNEKIGKINRCDFINIISFLKNIQAPKNKNLIDEIAKNILFLNSKPLLIEFIQNDDDKIFLDLLNNSFDFNVVIDIFSKYLADSSCEVFLKKGSRRQFLQFFDDVYEAAKSGKKMLMNHLNYRLYEIIKKHDKENYSVWLKFLLRAKNGGNKTAQGELAIYLESGLIKAQANAEEAFILMKNACKAQDQNPEFVRRFGLYYINGFGVEKSKENGIEVYKEYVFNLKKKLEFLLQKNEAENDRQIIDIKCNIEDFEKMIIALS